MGELLTSTFTACEEGDTPKTQQAGMSAHGNEGWQAGVIHWLVAVSTCKVMKSKAQHLS